MSSDRPRVGGNATALATPTFHWANLRTAAADTSGSGANYDLTSKDLTLGTMIPGGSQYAQDTDGFIDMAAEFGKAANSAEIRFYGTDAANEACGFELYAWKDGGPYVSGKMVFLAGATALIFGTQITSVNPVDGEALTGFWADTLTGTSYWPGGVTIAGSGSDTIVSMSFDLRGHRYLHLNIDAGTAATVGAIITAL